MKNNIYFIFILVILTFSCKEKVDITIPDVTNKPVYYSLISPYSIKSGIYSLQAHLTKSSGVNYNDIDTIRDATIYVYENSILKDTLQYSDTQNAYPFPLDFDFPSENKNYTIEVIKDNTVLISSETYIPCKIEIDSIHITPNIYCINNKYYFSKINIEFTDPVEDSNYYEVAVSRLSYDYYNNDCYNPLRTNDPIILSEPYYPSEIQMNAFPPHFLIFSDRTFNGKKKHLEFHYLSSINIGPQESNQEERYIVHLRHITKAYYLFKTSMLQNIQNQSGDFLYGAIEPINVISNIENGYGLFSGFNYDIKKYQISNGKVTFEDDSIESIKYLINNLKKYNNFLNILLNPVDNSLYNNLSFRKIRSSIKQLNILKEEIEKINDNRITFSDNYSSQRDSITKEKLIENWNNRGACSGNLSGFYVLPDGKVTICEQLYWHPAFIIGDLTKQSIMEMWNSKKALNLWSISKKEIQDNSPCKTCKEFEECRKGLGICWLQSIEGYGYKNWDYPPYECPLASPVYNKDIFYN